MGEAFIFGTGGGDNLKNAYAIILVEYPAGSTLTCSNAETGKSYKAGNTYGAWAFGVPSNGTWRVTASNSATGESAFHDVEITAEHQTERVKIDYWVNQLYENGNEFISVTGGWGTRAWAGISGWIAREPTVVKNSDHMELTWAGSSSTISSGALEILKDFDFTPYTRIDITYDNNITSGELYFIVQSRDATYARANAKATSSITSSTAGTDKVTSLDISSVVGAYDFAFVTRITNGTSSIKIKRVLLF